MTIRRKINFIDLYLFSIRLGLYSIFKKGKITQESIKRILCPLDPARYFELPKVANSLQLREGSKILDISSAKLLVFYLANHHPRVNFCSIDKFQGEIEAWKEIVDKPGNLTLSVGDATNLIFKSGTFDEAYSVSVIEHVRSKNRNGDCQMMKEVFRVLKNKGKFVFTTIVSREEGIVYKDREIYSKKRKRRRTFFYRIYDFKKIKKRLLDSTAFKVIKQEICNYRFPFAIYEQIFNSLSPYSALFGFLNILFVPPMLFEVRLPAEIKKRAEYFAILSKVDK